MLPLIPYSLLFICVLTWNNYAGSSITDPTGVTAPPDPKTTITIPAPPKILMPAVVRAFAGDKVTCSVTGSVPIHTAILKNSIVLVNTTSIATIELHEEGNYNCVATSKYGTDEQMFSVILLDCGSLKNNSLQSPGYPNEYQSNLDCTWQVTIPHGMAMRIHFYDFELEGDLCRYDYVEISNENNINFGKYCGTQTGKTIEITGEYAVIKFHSDSADQEKGFSLFFTAVLPSPPVISMPVVERAFVSEEMTCSVTGSPPIHIAILKDSTVLVNTTNLATVRFREEGNYSCVATSKYGTDVQEIVVILPGCGSLRNNSLQSPEYPNSYPRNMDCLYQVIIPQSMTMKIYFEDFALEEASLCRDDFVEISNQNNFTFGKYCGIQTGRTVEVSGDYAIITFHSDLYGQTRGFSLLFTAVLPSPPSISMPVLVRAFPGNEVMCLVTGSPPIHTVILNDSILLVNTTNTASFKFLKEGNYSCLATNKYGSVFRVFTVLDCRPTCSFGLRFYGWTLSCTNATPSYLMDCLPERTENLNLSSNAIKFLPVGLFAAAAIGLKDLDLSSNAITSLPEKVFAKLNSLRNLFLSSNAITFLPRELFANLTRLRHLDLSSNAITFLPETVFANLNSLHTLRLSSNSIASLPDGLFSDLTFLENLDLSSNTFTILPEGLFAKLTRLKTLHLSSNLINSLSEEIFREPNSLKYLDLSSNTIAFLPEGLFTKLTMLRHLYLSSNAITFIPEGIFSKQTELFLLELSSNAITSLQEGLFERQTKLNHLYLSSNGITSLPEGLFTKMIRLQELCVITYSP